MSEENQEVVLNEHASVFNGKLIYKDPNFVGPPMSFNTGGIKVTSGGDPNKPVYDANTDIVNCMPFALERLVHLLVAEVNNPLVDRIADANGIDGPDLMATYKAFCLTLDYFTGPQAVSTIDEAAKRSGYADRPDMEKILVEAMLGRIMLAHYWFGIRGRTEKSNTPTIPPAYDRLPVLWKEINCALDGIETPYAVKVKKKFGVELNDTCTPINETEDDDA